MSGQISIMDIVKTLLKRWWVLVIMMVLCAVGTYIYSEYFVKEVFVSTGSMYISNAQNDSAAQGTITTTNLTASEKLVNTTIEILKSDSFVNEVAKRSGLEISGAAVKSVMNLSPANETQLLSLSVSSRDPARAQTIANTILTYAPEYFMNIIRAGSVKVVDSATLPEKPSYPDVKKNVLFGILIGFVLGAIISFVIELMDTRVKPEDDLSTMYNLPVLGTIPALVSKEK